MGGGRVGVNFAVHLYNNFDVDVDVDVDVCVGVDDVDIGAEYVDIFDLCLCVEREEDALRRGKGAAGSVLHLHHKIIIRVVMIIFGCGVLRYDSTKIIWW